MKHHFCTYFDSYYLTRGLALYESLVRHCPEFQLWILCLDEGASQILSRLKLPHARLIRLEELEARFPELLSAKAGRNRLEYYYTCTPALPAFVLDASAEVDRITYLDADMWFFADPQGIFDELGSSSIGIVPHRYSEKARRLEAKSGVFNVSWITFRRDAEAARCLETWKSQCIEWCYDRPEDGLNADQKYLDAWPSSYSNLHIIEHPGAGCAPWNIANYQVAKNGAAVELDGRPLYFYHFHGLARVSDTIYDPVLSHFDAPVTKQTRDLIYIPYIAALYALQTMLSEADGENHPLGNIRKELYSQPPSETANKPVAVFRKAAHIARCIVAGRHLFIPSLPRLAKDMEPSLSHTIPGLGATAGRR